MRFATWRPLLLHTLPFLAGVAALLLLAQQELGYWRTAPHPLTNIQPAGGAAYAAPLPQPVRALGETWDFSFVLWENGLPRHNWTTDPALVQSGRGDFFPQPSQILFSARDGTDPRTNGRSYAVSSAARPPAVWLDLAALLAGGGHLLLCFLRPQRKMRLWFWTMGLGIIAIAAAIRVGMPAAPFIWPDSWGYISPSVDFESTGRIGVTFRESFYPALVGLIMRLGQSVAFLATVQHLLNLAALVLMLLVFRELARAARLEGLAAGAVDLVALLTVAALGLSRLSDFYGQYLMPEAVFPFFAAAAAWIMARALRLRCTGAPAVRTGWWLAAAAFACLGLFAVIPRWGFAATLAGVPALLIILHPGLSWPRRLTLAVLPLIMFLAVYVIPDALLRRRCLPEGNSFLGMHLLAIHADILRTELQRARVQHDPRWPAQLLDGVIADIDRERVRYATNPGSIGSTPSLGFNADQLMYEDSAISRLGRHFGSDRRALSSFCVHFYLAGWMHQPRAMAGKVRHQLAGLIAQPQRLFLVRDYSYTPAELLPDSRRLIGDEFRQRAGNSAWSRYPELLDQPPAIRIVLRQQPFVQRLHAWAARWYFRFFLISAGLAVVSAPLVWRLRGPRRSIACTLLALGGAGTLLYAPNFLNSLTVATIHTLDLDRYLDAQAVFSLLAVGGSACLLIAAVAHLSRVIFSNRPVVSP